MAIEMQRLSAIALLMVVAVIGCGARESDLVVKADRHIVRHEFDQAEATLSEAIAADPSNDALVLLRGRVRMELGDWEAAEADFSDYISRVPDDTVGYLNRANSLERQGRTDEAGQVRNVARSLDPYYNDFNNLYSQLPDSSRPDPFEIDADSLTILHGENQVEGDEFPVDSLDDLFSDPSTSDRPSSDDAAEPDRVAEDTAEGGIDESYLPYSTGRSIIDQIIARHGGSLESEPLEDPSEESDDDKSPDDLAEAEGPVPTPYRWNDYLRNSGYPGLVGQSPIPRSTGLNPPTVRPSGTGLPTVPVAGRPTNTTTPLTTGLQSSRGSGAGRPATTPTPGTARSSLPVERPAPPTTGIQSGSRP